MRKILCLAIVATIAGLGYAITPTAPVGPNPGAYYQTDSMMASLGLANVNVLSDYNIWINPARLSGKIASAEIWQGATWGGTTIGLPVGTLGVFVGRPYGGYVISGVNINGSLLRVGTGDDPDASVTFGSFLGGGAVTGVDPAIGDLRVLAPAIDFDLLYSLDIGLMKLGLRITQAGNTAKVSQVYQSTGVFAKDGTATSDRKSTDMQTAIGATIKDLALIEELDVSISMSQPTVDNSYTEKSWAIFGATQKDITADAKLKTDAGTNMAILVRGIVPVGDNKLIASVISESIDNSSTLNWGSDNDNEAANLEMSFTDKWVDKTTGMGLNAAYHTMPMDSLKAIYTFGYASISRENKYTSTDNLGTTDDGTPKGTTEDDTLTEARSGITLGLALEHQTFKTIKTRVGVSRAIMQTQSVKLTDTDNLLATNTADIYDGGAKKTTIREDTLTTQGPTTVSAGLGIELAKDLNMDLQVVSGALAGDLMLNIVRATVKYSF